MVLLPSAHVPVGPLYGRFFDDLQWALRRLDYTVVQYGGVGLAPEDAARWPELALDGVFAYNDEYAMLLMRALQDAGVAVPGQTAVVGADDLLLGRLLRPRLSTVRIDPLQGGELAELVDGAVNGTAVETITRPLLDSRVVRRESS